MNEPPCYVECDGYREKNETAKKGKIIQKCQKLLNNII